MPTASSYNPSQSWAPFSVPESAAMSGSVVTNDPGGGGNGGGNWNSGETSMDVDLGGWGRVSDPLPGMQLEMHQPAIHPQESMQTSDHQLLGQGQYAGSGMPYTQPESKFDMSGFAEQQQQSMGFYVSNPQPMSMPK